MNRDITPTPITAPAPTQASATAERLSADARLILDCVAALGGISESKGVPAVLFDELTEAGCLAADGRGGYSATDLGGAVATAIRERQAMIRRALGEKA